MKDRKALILALVSGLSIGVYLFASHVTYRLGFPLDDAWIHQTYARNLAEAGEWAFIRGQSSGGSTSPMWSALLVLGSLAGLGPFVWTFTLGWLVLWGISLVGSSIFEDLCPDKKVYGVWGGESFLPWSGTWHGLRDRGWKPCCLHWW